MRFWNFTFHPLTIRYGAGKTALELSREPNYPRPGKGSKDERFDLTKFNFVTGGFLVYRANFLLHYEATLWLGFSGIYLSKNNLR